MAIHDFDKKEISSPSVFLSKDKRGMISFGSGQPDFLPPSSIMEKIFQPEDFFYSAIEGNADLRAKLASQYVGCSASDVVITNGASEALDLLLRFIAIKYPDKKKVLLPLPYYYSYLPLVKMAGLQEVYYSLESGNLDLDVFREKIKGCSVVLVNSPSNPLGTVIDDETLLQIEQIVAKEGAYLIFDEVYRRLSIKHFMHFHYERTIVVDSFSKTFCMCGVRVGFFCTKSREIVEGIIEMKTHTSMNTSNLSQRLALATFDLESEYLEEIRSIWKKRRDFLWKKITDLGLNPIVPEGAFFIFVPFKHASRAIYDLFHHYNVIIYDGRWFGVPDSLRFGYTLNTDMMEKGMTIFEEFLKKDYVLYD